MLLRAYLLDDNADVISVWYDQYAGQPKVRAKLDMRMLHLRPRRRDERDGWNRPYYDTLERGVGEVRFEIGNIQYRPIGFFGPAREEFTFLLFAIEQSDRLQPRNAIDEAVRRRGVVQSDPSRSVLIKGRWGQ
jgi:hypothetical protein